jgi:hypothetical protein
LFPRLDSPLTDRLDRRRILDGRLRTFSFGHDRFFFRDSGFPHSLIRIGVERFERCSVL